MLCQQKEKGLSVTGLIPKLPNHTFNDNPSLIARKRESNDIFQVLYVYASGKVLATINFMKYSESKPHVVELLAKRLDNFHTCFTVS